MAFKDDISEAGEAYMGQGLSPHTNMQGCVQLWNPWESGKLLYVDQLVCAGEQKLVADIRKCQAPLATLFADHISNKKIDGPASVAQIRISSGPDLTDYPYNRPVQEIWGSASNDKTFVFDPPIIVPQGHGIAFLAADSRAIASWQWREKVDPLGSVPAPQTPPAPSDPVLIGGSVGTVTTDMTNGANAFDGNDTTFANDAETSAFYIGKGWSSATSVCRFVVKSPVGRSFSGGSPGRVLTWTLQTYDGSGWVNGQSGIFTEIGQASQQVIDVTLASPVTALGHRVRIQDTAIAAHRVATVEFWTS